MPQNSKFQSSWLPPLAVFFIALVVRLLIMNELREASPLFEHPVIDAEKYDQFARALARSGQWAGREVFFQPPTYAFFLSMIYRVFGESYIWPRVIQSFMGASSCLMIFFIGKRLGTKHVGLISGLICALYGPLLYFELDLLAPVLIIFWSQAGLLLLLRALEKQRPAIFFLSGICFGLALISWPVAGIFTVASIFFIFWKFLKKPVIAAQAALLIIVGAALPVLPITAHNVKHGQFVFISDNGGRNFYVGNNENWQETMFVRPGHRWQSVMTLPYRLYGEEEVNRAGASPLFFKISSDYIKKEPLTYVKGEIIKLYQLLYGYEIMNPTDMYFLKRYSPTLNALIFQNELVKFPFGLLLPIAVIGIIRSIRSDYNSGVLMIFLLSGVAAIILFIVTARYRLILVPFLSMFAAMGILELIGLFKDRKKLDSLMITAIVTALAVGAVSNLDISKKQELFYNPVSESQPYFTIGRFLNNQRQPHEALPWFEKAVQIDPAFSDAWVSIGNVKCDLGDYDGCITALLTAQSITPDYPLPLYNLALIYDQHPSLPKQTAVDYYKQFIAMTKGNFYTIFPQYLKMTAYADERLRVLMAASRQ